MQFSPEQNGIISRYWWCFIPPWRSLGRRSPTTALLYRGVLQALYLSGRVWSSLQVLEARHPFIIQITQERHVLFHVKSPTQRKSGVLALFHRTWVYSCTATGEGLLWDSLE